MWFHQDWKLVFPDFFAGTTLYLRNLSGDEQTRRRDLALQLRVFLQAHATAAPGELKQRWLELGAQGWQSTLEIREPLQRFLTMIESEDANGQPKRSAPR